MEYLQYRFIYIAPVVKSKVLNLIINGIPSILRIGEARAIELGF